MIQTTTPDTNFYARDIFESRRLCRGVLSRSQAIHGVHAPSAKQITLALSLGFPEKEIIDLDKRTIINTIGEHLSETVPKFIQRRLSSAFSINILMEKIQAIYDRNGFDNDDIKFLENPELGKNLDNLSFNLARLIYPPLSEITAKASFSDGGRKTKKEISGQVIKYKSEEGSCILKVLQSGPKQTMRWVKPSDITKVNTTQLKSVYEQLALLLQLHCGRKVEPAGIKKEYTKAFSQAIENALTDLDTLLRQSTSNDEPDNLSAVLLRLIFPPGTMVRAEKAVSGSGKVTVYENDYPEQDHYAVVQYIGQRPHQNKLQFIIANAKLPERKLSYEYYDDEGYATSKKGDRRKFYIKPSDVISQTPPQ